VLPSRENARGDTSSVGVVKRFRFVEVMSFRKHVTVTLNGKFFICLCFV
jgi:hypothetical protein